MTNAIHDHDHTLEALIESGYQATQNPDCLAGDHSWRPAGDGDFETIRCTRCQTSPHVKTRRTERTRT